MATTTTHYGFDIPQSTDLVKDGATAIATLGQDIDTAMNTALGTKKAMGVLLSTVSFSAVASQSINDVFSATYDNYKIMFDLAGSTTLTLTMRLRVSGADNSTSNYNEQYVLGTGASILANRNSGATSWVLDGSQTTHRTQYNLDIINPFIAQNTGVISEANLSYTNGSNIRYLANSQSFSASTSFTGFSIIASTGNITGTVRVYGYNQ